jgi:hypothetical protein
MLCTSAPIAQWIEHLPSKQSAGGSSPPWGAVVTDPSGERPEGVAWGIPARMWPRTNGRGRGIALPSLVYMGRVANDVRVIVRIVGEIRRHGCETLSRRL